MNIAQFIYLRTSIQAQIPLFLAIMLKIGLIYTIKTPKSHKPKKHAKLKKQHNLDLHQYRKNVIPGDLKILNISNFYKNTGSGVLWIPAPASKKHSPRGLPLRCRYSGRTTREDTYTTDLGYLRFCCFN